MIIIICLIPWISDTSTKEVYPCHQNSSSLAKFGLNTLFP